ncbi:MAG: flavin reductase [Elusimicrobia bacterium]|nr:flavin reductase [Elusimicrobiota bacterium]
MKQRELEFSAGFAELCRALRGGGAFLVVQDETGRPNPMTIGWALAGVVWGEPIMTVLVRPSRHTFGLLERSRRFSVCVPEEGQLADELAFCGSKSGRDCDKVESLGLKVGPGLERGVSVLEGCGLAFECETVHKTQVLPETLDADIIAGYYPQGDFHSIFNGRILRSYKLAHGA